MNSIIKFEFLKKFKKNLIKKELFHNSINVNYLLNIELHDLLNILYEIFKFKCKTYSPNHNEYIITYDNIIITIFLNSNLSIILNYKIYAKNSEFYSLNSEFLNKISDSLESYKLKNKKIYLLHDYSNDFQTKRYITNTLDKINNINFISICEFLNSNNNILFFNGNVESITDSISYHSEKNSINICYSNLTLFMNSDWIFKFFDSDLQYLIIDNLNNLENDMSMFIKYSVELYKSIHGIQTNKKIIFINNLKDNYELINLLNNINFDKYLLLESEKHNMTIH